MQSPWGRAVKVKDCFDTRCSDCGSICKEHPDVLEVVAGVVVEWEFVLVVVVIVGRIIVLVEGDEVDVVNGIDVVVEEEAEDVVVRVDEEDVVVELYSQVEQGSNTFITIISANGHESANGP